MLYRKIVFFIFIFKIFFPCFSKLIGVVEIIRHGARTPMNFLESSAKLYFGSRKGQLTVNGFRQHVLLGRWLRRRYVYGDVEKLFSESLDPKEIKVYSSPRQRTIFSATAHIMGLFPNSFTKIIYMSDDFKNNDTPPLKNFHINRYDGMEIKINVYKYRNDFMFHSLFCYYKGSKKILKKTIQKFPILNIEKKQISDASHDILNKYSFILKRRQNFRTEKDYLEFQKNYQKKEFTKSFLRKLIDFIRPFKYHHINYEKLIPENFTTVKKFLLNKWYEIRVKDSKGLRISVSAIFHKILKFFDNRINKKISEKMIIFSGHDNNIVDVFTNIMNPDYLLKMIYKAPHNLEHYFFLIPRLASSLIFELHEENNDYFINIVYNGQCYNNLEFRDKVRLSPITKKLYYEDFKVLLTKRIEKDYKKLKCRKRGY